MTDSHLDLLDSESPYEWTTNDYQELINIARKYNKLKEVLEPIREYCQTCGPSEESVIQVCKRPEWWGLDGAFSKNNDIAIPQIVLYKTGQFLNENKVVQNESETFLW